MKQRFWERRFDMQLFEQDIVSFNQKVGININDGPFPLKVSSSGHKKLLETLRLLDTLRKSVANISKTGFPRKGEVSSYHFAQ